jgi:high-affinity Fe2+/Pb2+ permease
MTKILSNFNKQIIAGELGALLFAPVFGWVFSRILRHPDFVSFFTVLGSIIGGVIFWLAFRIRHEKKNNTLSVKKMASDVACYTPAALTFALFVYYPTLFLITKFMIEAHHRIIFSILFAQLSALILFLLAMNVYRILLIKFFGKKL